MAACDSYSGAWCPYPRPCTELRKCIRELTNTTKTKVTKQAFFRYLDDAPKIEDENAANVEECGELREYFEYDRNYYDDDRICEEVENLQCFTDFSNLDGFATGSAGGNAADEVLIISTRIVKKQGSKYTDSDALCMPSDVLVISLLVMLTMFHPFLSTLAPFDSGKARAWRISNVSIQKAHRIAQNLLNVTKISDDICDASIGPLFIPPFFFGPAGISASPCVFLFTILKTVQVVSIFVLKEVSFFTVKNRK